jgi:hypothetical protein
LNAGNEVDSRWASRLESESKGSKVSRFIGLKIISDLTKLN